METPPGLGKKRKQYLWNSGLDTPRSTLSMLKKRALSSTQTQSEIAIPSTTSARESDYIQKRKSTYPNWEDPCSLQISTLQDEHEIGNKLYSGAKITEDEAALLLIGFMSKHKLTRDSSNGLLELINFFLPVGIGISESIYSLKKSLPNCDITTTHLYCNNCDEYIGPSTSQSADVQCSSCLITVESSSLIKAGSYFLLFDFKSQLESLLRNPELSRQVYSNLKIRSANLSENFRDIMDGDMYKSLQLKNFDMSCTFNTDGVPVFKSSKVSIWPILVSLNELNSGTRFKNTIIVGLWLGHKKPVFDTYFSPFVDVCAELSQSNKVKWFHGNDEIESKVYFPICVADSVARCLCQGTNQFNGAFGCSWCLSKGETWLNGRSKKWIYIPNPDIQPRNKASHIEHLKALSKLLRGQSKIKHHFGVKSASKLLLIPNFDIIDGFVFDYMHAAFLGVTRAFTNAWLDSKHHEREFYIGRKTDLINKQLMMYRVPGYFSRSIRTISDKNFWKASEWRNWGYILNVALENILPNKYLQHFAKFVRAIMLLSSNQVSREDTYISQTLINQFVTGVESLYGREFCSFNCHSLIHAPRCVRNWGPLFGYSAFQFENFNGTLLNMFNGSQKIDMQISNRINELLCSVQLSYGMKQTPAVEYFLRKVRNMKFRKTFKKIGSTLYFGKSKLYLLSKHERKLLQHLHIKAKTVKCYNSCFVNSFTFSTKTDSSLKRVDNVAEADGEFFLIKKIFVANNSNSLCFCSKVIAKVEKNLQPYCFRVTSISNTTCVLDMVSLRSKFICCKSKTGTVLTITKLPNTIECE